MNLSFYRNLVILNGLIPGAILAWDAWQGHLGSNSVNNAIHITGILTLVFLFLSLMITPLRAITGWSSLIAYRRSLGLFSFAYGVLHLTIYFLLDRMGSLSSTIEEITTRRFLLVGFVALSLMLPLALTSTNAMIRRLGPSRWKLLHRLVYVVAILGVLHYYLLVKSDVRQPLAFAAVLVPLLGFRSVKHYFDLRRELKQATATVGPAGTTNYYTGELVVASIHPETHDVKTFRLVNRDGGDIPFVHQPGQYLNLMLNVDDQAVRRSYTIASSPAQRAHIELTIKRDPQGIASRWLHDGLQVGDTLAIGGPAGKFHFHGGDSAAVLLIAGGVGITPVMSMLRHLTDHAWKGTIYFVNVVRTPSDLIFGNELISLAVRYDNLHFLQHFTQPHPAVSDGQFPQQWQVRDGYLDAAGLQTLVPDLSSVPIFLCGPDPMMAATRDLLLSIGAAPANIMTEEFVSPHGVEPQDAIPQNAHVPGEFSLAPLAEITFAKSAKKVQINRNQTVLEGAEAAQVSLPWECRSGICGQCKVRCTSGRVQMDAMDAITASEVDAGWILACQSHAIDQALTVEA